MMNQTASQNSEFNEHAPASSPLVRRTPRPTVLSRVSRTMSQIFENSAQPPPSTLAPPGSPHEQPGDARDVPEYFPRVVSPCASTGSHLSPSELPPLVRRLKPSLVLENSGSVARDHLASERTFLAYVRTSLVIASTGVALVQLFTISSNTTTDNKLSFIPTTRSIQAWARPLGATMVCFGLVVLALGTIRYFRIQSALTQGMFPVARLTAASVTFVLATIVILVFAIMLSARS
ncbi:7 transmembrane receptor (Rhodopsin family) domain protein [Mycena venus]|uniref:7 transmembrane receptor (Rhodopsin family) domain protein n=1 Tax=Mycena venus TaxID=2733690 RepID=A0A8H6Y9G4_9AGAR|nr:7 transmembrane receptor (Rhodopsin family) domain protein [Mycena venus]